MSFTFLIENTIFVLISVLNQGYPKLRLDTKMGQYQGVLFPENFGLPKDWTSGL